MLMIYIVTLTAVCVVSWIMTGMLRRYALSRSLMDIPNARSSHTIPTPRGGGVAIVLSFLFAMMLLWSMGILQPGLVLALVGAGIFVALTGFIDDHGHIPAGWRLLAHFAAAAWGLYWIGGLPPLTVFGFELVLGWFGHLLAVVYLVWLLNLYNFMDGIDGIASIEAITVCMAGAVLFWLNDIVDVSMYLPSLVLAAATIGFLIWNFPPAKIFMGDAGSGFIGLLLGLFSIVAAHVGSSLFWGWIILLGVFIVDATVTLIRRVLHGQAFYEAHRSHAYQYLSRKLASHRSVSIGVGVINLVWLLPIAAACVLGYIDGLMGVLIAYSPLVLLALWLKAGNEKQQEV
jgi:Fuc2NAc and GlcNAc transferase